MFAYCVLNFLTKNQRPNQPLEYVVLPNLRLSCILSRLPSFRKMSMSQKIPPLLSIFFITFLSTIVSAQDYEIPERPALKISSQIPQDASELSVAFAKGATAKKCTTGKEPTCTCLSYKNIHVRKWTPELMSGISYSDKNHSFFIETFNPKTHQYSGFWNISDSGWRADLLTSSLERIRLGKVSKPEYCSNELPTLKEKASALKAVWSKADQQWKLEGYQRKNTISGRNFSEEQQAGFLSPTLFIGENQYEIQGGYYLPVIGSQLMATLSTKRVGVGVGLITRRPLSDNFSQLEIGGRVDFESATPTPFLNGDLFVGSRRAHISGRFDIDENYLSRPLVGRRLFQNTHRNKVGVLLSGDSHHLRFAGMQRKLDTVKQEISGEYTSRFLLQDTALDMHLRYEAVDLESEAPLQSTTLSLRLNHRFGDPGLYLTPSVQLTNNFSTIPIDKGFDASTTGFMMGQLSTGVRFIGRFSDLSHIVNLQILGGRDLFGFQQRAIRDGGSPFTFQRQPDLTYAWAGIENSLLSRAWNLELPLGVLVDNIDQDWLATPLLRFKFSAKDLRLGIETMCTDECSDARFRASANVDVPKLGCDEIALSVQYGLSDYTTTDFMRSRIRESASQMFNFQTMVNSDNAFLHSAHIKVGFDTYEFGVEGYVSDAFEGILATMRLQERLGWTVDSRLGWSSQSGASAQFGFSANSRFFSR